MLKFLGALVVVIAILLGASYYVGWWSFSTQDEHGNFNISITVDKEKIEQDKKKALNKIEQDKKKVLDKQ
jgi:hypothetical protein